MVFDFANARKAALDIKDYRVLRFILYPPHWTAYPNKPTLSWKRERFNKASINLIPDDKHGVYSFVAESQVANHPAASYLLYVGKAKDTSFRGRYRKYLRATTDWKDRPHIAEMVGKWTDHLWFYYAEVDDVTLIDDLEAELIIAFMPPQNRAFPAKITHIVRMVFS